MLLNNIVLTGGNSILSGLPQRLQIELSSLFTAGFSTHITKQLTQFERVFGTWIGGSICASLSSFLPRFIFRSEYEEFGMNILSRKML
jgi:actin-related protein